MSGPVRFLLLAVVGWAGIRGATLGVVPGAELFTPARARPALPPIVATVFPPLEPVSLHYAPADPSFGYPGQSGLAPMPAGVPVYYHYPVPAGYSRPLAEPLRPREASYSLLPEPAPLFYSPIPHLDDWPISRIASASPPLRSGGAPLPGAAAPVHSGRLDRLQLSAWALLRGRPGAGSLATSGTLGGSQAGARLTYALDRRLALSLRSSSPVGGTQGAEVAAGVRVTPIPAIPVAITAERRQAIGRFGGRSAFALFAEGGLYQRPLPWDLALDAYAQGGVVGARRRDLFIDGGLTVTRPLLGPMSLRGRPLFGGLSAGIGVWGGAQPELSRLDAGPRVSLTMRRNIRVHLDYRQRLAGNAEPGSGPAVTLAGDF